MSAFLVSTATMNAVLDGMMNIRDRLYSRHVRFNVDRGHVAPMDKLGQDLFMMNLRALNARYGDEVPDGVKYHYPMRFMATPLEHSLRACECLMYQCNEGNVPDEPLYKELATFAEELRAAIIDRLPKYQSAPWDFMGPCPELKKVEKTS
jgi:hypothetical protein